jgi:ribosomal-protein-alanine N-acetyltransferase
MSAVQTLAPNLTLRWMIQRDLPYLLQIEQQHHALRWTQPDFLSVFQSIDTAGCVAEIGDRVVGYLIYSVPAQQENGENAAEDLPSVRERWKLHKKKPATPQPLRIILRNIAVAREWQRQGVGRALLERFERKLRHPADRIQAIAPDTNLPIQLLLRNAGYKAIRVLREYFGAADGYLMERQREPK